MSIDLDKAWVGTTNNLGWEQSWVAVRYEDEDGEVQEAFLCANGARVLAKSLRFNADVIDPPKPRKPRG